MKTFEEYNEGFNFFRKKKEVIRPKEEDITEDFILTDMRFYRNPINIHDFARLARIGTINEIIKHGEWYRLRWKNKIDSVLNSRIIKVYNYMGDDNTNHIHIGIFEEYKNGRSVPTEGKGGFEVIDINVWFCEFFTIEHLELKVEHERKKLFNELNIQIGDMVDAEIYHRYNTELLSSNSLTVGTPKYNIVEKIKIFKIRNQTYFGKDGNGGDTMVFFPENIIKKYDKQPRINIDIDPYGEEDWDVNESLISTGNKIEIDTSNAYACWMTLNNNWYKVTRNVSKEIEKKFIFFKTYKNYTEDETKIIKIRRITDNDFGVYSIVYDTEYIDGKIKRYEHEIYLDFYEIYVEEMIDPDYINKHPKEDPYGEEDWDDSNESKFFNRKKINKELDPYGEEDWGWETNIDETQFKGKYLIFKNLNIKGNNFYLFTLLNNHFEFVWHLPDRFELDGTNGNLDSLYAIPLTKKEIGRIKNDKILLIPHGYLHHSGKFLTKNDLGQIVKVPFSKLGTNDVHFLDQEYKDNYLDD